MTACDPIPRRPRPHNQRAVAVASRWRRRSRRMPTPHHRSGHESTLPGRRPNRAGHHGRAEPDAPPERLAQGRGIPMVRRDARETPSRVSRVSRADGAGEVVQGRRGRLAHNIIEAKTNDTHDTRARGHVGRRFSARIECPPAHARRVCNPSIDAAVVRMAGQSLKDAAVSDHRERLGVGNGSAHGPGVQAR